MEADHDGERLARIETKVDFIIDEIAELKEYRKETEKRFQKIETKLLLLTVAAVIGGGAAGAYSQAIIKLIF